MKNFLVVCFLFLSLSVFAQQAATTSVKAEVSDSKIEMADQLRESGKIYVLVTVIATIFLGFTVYTVNIDRKVSRLEKELKG